MTTNNKTDKGMNKQILLISLFVCFIFLVGWMPMPPPPTIIHTGTSNNFSELIFVDTYTNGTDNFTGYATIDYDFENTSLNMFSEGTTSDNNTLVVNGIVYGDNFCIDGLCLTDLNGSNTSGYIPYTGAITNVDLGINNLTTNNLFLDSGNVITAGDTSKDSIIDLKCHLNSGDNAFRMQFRESGTSAVPSSGGYMQYNSDLNYLEFGGITIASGDQKGFTIDRETARTIFYGDAQFNEEIMVPTGIGINRAILVTPGISVDGSGSYIEFGTSGVSGYGGQIGAVRDIGGAGDGSLFFNTGSNTQEERMRISNAGNVGIGTSSPDTLLDVTGDIAGYADYAVIQDTSDPGAGATTLRIKNTVSDLGLRAYGSSAPAFLASAVGMFANNNMIQVVGTGKKLYMAADNNYVNPEMTIDDGVVGIGITTPTAILHLGPGTTTKPSLKFEAGTLLTTPEAGSIEYDGNKFYITNHDTQKVIDRTSDVALTTVTVENTITETTLWTGKMSANSLDAGNLFKFEANGVIQNGGATAADEVTLRIKVGGTTVASLRPTTKSIPIGSHWHIKAVAVQRTIGVAGSRAVHIDLEIDGTEESIVGIATIDTTANMDVTVTAEWASTDTNNIISLYQGFMEYKN